MRTDSAMYFQRIFHPSDFSDASNMAFAHALKLAVATSGRLTILHTGSDSDSDWKSFPRVRSTLERWDLLPPGSSTDAIFSLGLDVEKIASPHTDPVRAVLHYLKKHPHDLIVMATHQHEGLDRWTHKAVAEPIARRSGELTLFIPYECDGFVSQENSGVRLRNILIPIDAKPNPQYAVDGAISVAHTLDCKQVTFHLLHVGQKENFPETIRPQRDEWEWHRLVKHGPIEQEILDYASECQADLVVMATEGHHGFLDALRGSTTERILRAVKCPLLAVPAFEEEGNLPEPVLWRPAV